jgi:arylsulfatase
LFALVPAQAFVADWLQSFREFPPRQKAATFGIDQVMDKLTTAGTGSN